MQELNSANTNIEFETLRDLKTSKNVNPVGKILLLDLNDKVMNLSNAISMIKQIACVDVST